MRVDRRRRRGQQRRRLAGLTVTAADVVPRGRRLRLRLPLPLLLRRSRHRARLGPPSGRPCPLSCRALTASGRSRSALIALIQDNGKGRLLLCSKIYFGFSGARGPPEALVCRWCCRRSGRGSPRRWPLPHALYTPPAPRSTPPRLLSLPSPSFAHRHPAGRAAAGLSPLPKCCQCCARAGSWLTCCCFLAGSRRAARRLLHRRLEQA